MPDLPFRPVANGYHAALHRDHVEGVWVVRSAEELRASWQRLMADAGEPAAPPAVDWATDMVVVYALGQRPTGGFDAVVERVLAEDGVLRVFVREKRPGAGAVTASALSNPYHLVATPRRDLPLEVVRRVEVADHE